MSDNYVQTFTDMIKEMYMKYYINNIKICYLKYI